MLPYIAEFLGTMMLIILGDGVVANVNLNKSGMKGAGAVQITLAWGLAVLVPAFIFGEASGASFNPALTIALAVDGSFAWSMVPGYVSAHRSFTCSSRDSLTLQKIREQSLAYSVQVRRSRTLD